MAKVLLCAAVLVLSVPAVGVAQEWDQYKPSTLAKVEQEQQGTATDDINITAGDWKYRVTVTWLGDARPVSVKTAAVIGSWVKALGLDKRIPELFQDEIRVREGERVYWLPIQKPLLPSLREEVKAGESVELYVMWIGSAKKEFVFLVNEFQESK